MSEENLSPNRKLEAVEDDLEVLIPGDMEGAYEVWKSLPEEIRNDTAFRCYQQYTWRLAQTEASNKSPGSSSGTKKKKSLKFDVDEGACSSKAQFCEITNVMVTNPSDDSHVSYDEITIDPNSPKKTEENEEKEEDEKETSNSGFASSWLNNIKVSFLLTIWIMSCVVLMVVKQYSDINNSHQISVPPNMTRSYWILQSPTMRHIKVELEGAILPTYYGNLTTKYMRVWIDLIQTRIPMGNISQRNIFYRRTISDVWLVPIVSEDVIDFAPEVRQSKLFDINDIEIEMVSNSLMCLQFSTNLAASFPISISYDLSPINTEDGIVYATFILFGLYFLIITEIVHRTVAAMLAATVCVAVLAMFGERPSHQEIVSWVDLETLTLLFSMMVFVAIFSETGVFDYLAVMAYRLSSRLSNYTIFRCCGGRIWMLINILCINTVLVSSFLDNVTTILLMTPVTIRLCEVMDLNPTPVLMAMIIFSNIGGAITPIGDPPNVIIANNKDIINAGITFGVFTTHMGIVLTIIMILVHFQLRFMFRNLKDLQYEDPEEQGIKKLRHEIVIWQRAAASLSSYSKDEDYVRETLMKRVQRLLSEMKEKLLTGREEKKKKGGEVGEARRAVARDTARLVTATVGDNNPPPPPQTTTAQSSQPRRNSNSNRENSDETTRKMTVEDLDLGFHFPIKDKPLLVKSTVSLMFVIVTFGLQSVFALHLSMGSIALLGALLLLLLHREDIVDVMARVEWSTLLFFTSLFILMESIQPFSSPAVYTSTVATAGVDRGNGTLIGSSSNLVCACVAERHGYKFTFMEFSRIGFPVMLWSLIIATVYLMIVHVWLGFNG